MDPAACPAPSRPVARSLRVAVVCAVLALLAPAASAELLGQFGTQYVSTNPDGSHNWETTFTNLSNESSSDYSIWKLDLWTRLVAESDSYSKGTWVAEGASESMFTASTMSSLDYLRPQLALGGPSDRQLLVGYTTPPAWSNLAPRTVKAYSHGAGNIDVQGELPAPVPEPATAALALLAATLATLAKRVRRGERGVIGRERRSGSP